MSETRASQPQGSLPIEATDPSGATILGVSPNSSGLPSPPIWPEPLTRSPSGFAMRAEPLADVGVGSYGYGVGQTDPAVRPPARLAGAPPPSALSLPLPPYLSEPLVSQWAYQHNPWPIDKNLGPVERSSEHPRQTMAWIQGDPYAPISGPMSHPQGAFAEATQALGLTPQEQYLYQHHLHNLMGPGHVTQSGGEVSTLLQTNVQGPDGRYYNIPTVWYGQQLPMPLARLMAAQAGWDKWPAYADPGEAERRYYDMHQYITRDLALIGR